MTQSAPLWKKVFLSILFLFLCAAFGTLIIPTLVSTQLGNSIVTKTINYNLNGTIRVEKVNIGWFQSQQSFENIYVLDHDGNPILSLGELDFETSLFDAIFAKNTYLSFKKLNLDLRTDPSGTTNIDHFIDANKRFARGESRLDQIKGANGSIRWDKDLNLNIAGHTQGSATGSFNLETYFPSLKDLDTSDYLDRYRQEIFLNIHLNEFPVTLLDQAIRLKVPVLKNVPSQILGDSVNLEIQTLSTQSSPLLRLALASPFAKAMVNGEVSHQRFRITEQGFASFTLTPLQWQILKNLLKIKSKLKLDTPTQATLVIKKLSFDFKTAPLSVDLKTLAIDSQLTLRDFTFTIEKNPPITLSQFDTKFFSKENFLIFELEAEIAQNSFKSPLKLFASGQKFSTSDQLAESILKTGTLGVEFTKIPVPFLDELFNTDNLLQTSLGNFAKLNFQVKPLDQSGLALDLDLETDYLTIKQFKAKIIDNLLTLESAPVNYVLTPFSLSNLTQDIAPLILEKEVLFTLDLQKFAAPINNHTIDFDKVKMEFTLHSDLLKFSQLPFFDQIALKNIHFNFTGKDLSHSQAFFETQVVHPHPLLGKDGTFKIETALALSNFSSGVHKIKGFFTSDIAKIQTEMEISQNSLAFLSPTKVTYEIDPSRFTHNQMKLNLKHLSEPVSIALTIQPPKNVSFKTLISDLKLSGLIAINKIIFSTTKNQFSKIEDLIIPWEIDASSNKISVNLSGKSTIGNNEQGRLEGVLHIKDWIESGKVNFKHALVESNFNLEKIPVAFFEVIANDPDLSILLGDSLSILFKMHFPLRHFEKGDLEFNLKGEDIKAQGKFKLGENLSLFDSNNPLKLQYNLTTDRLDIIQRRFSGESQLRLKFPSQLLLTISQISIPFSHENLNLMSFNSQLQIDKLRLLDLKSNESISLDQVASDIKTSNLKEMLSFNLSAKEKETPSKQGNILIAGTINDPLSQKEAFNLETLKMNLQVKGQNIPLSLMSQLFSSADWIKQLIGLFGPSPDIQLEMDVGSANGSIAASVESEQGKAELNASLSQGLITLQKNFILESSLNSPESALVFEKILPFLGGMEKAHTPLRLLINKDGFYWQIHDNDLAGLQVKGGLLDLGQLDFKPKSPIAIALSILHTQKINRLPIWFTPLYFNISQGTLKVERMDMFVLNRYPLAFWGKVNFKKDKVNLFLGLSSIALNQAFNAQGLDQNFILPIPISGTIGKASIDKKKATSRITSVVAKGRGPQGKLLGTFLDLTSGGYKSETIPTPTTLPFPWETLESYQNLSKKEQENSAIQRGEPMIDLEKGTELLNSLFE